jgi:hypothetical protein
MLVVEVAELSKVGVLVDQVEEVLAEIPEVLVLLEFLELMQRVVEAAELPLVLYH